MPQLNVQLPDGLDEELNELVENDEFWTSKSEAVRHALREMIQAQRRKQ
jgi:Arc/MetJ-type ribon-helix-helix transcriptional regulator